MVKSLFTGVTGLKSHQQRMDMIGNNIANVNTVGFKTDVMTFADVYYQTKRNPSAPTSTLGGINPRQVGYGVKVSSVEANLSQSGYNYTDNKTDIALDGKGFFQLMDGAGNIYYTRAGHFKFDEAGYLVNDDGFHVLGVSGECDGVSASSDIIRAVIPKTDNHVSSATKVVNGANVTVSVSAPSEYTNMSVAFKHADFPYATYANNILTIFFNQEQQFDSKQDFDNEIRKALTAGGVNLPDDVELTMDIEPIPDEVNSVAAHNTVEEFKFTTFDSTCRFHFSKDNAGQTYHAYIDFSVQDNGVRDTVILKKSTTNKVVVDYDKTKSAWTIEIADDTTASDINDALRIYLALDENSQVPKLSCTAFTIPTNIDRKTAIDAFTGTLPPVTAGYDFSDLPAVPANGKTLYGAAPNDMTGMFDFAVKEKGSFGNNYSIQFAKKSGYGNTSAAWEENTLTINICADTTIADVNAAIKKASGGNEKKIITFYDINGLDYGKPTVVTNLDGTVSYEYALGYTLTGTNWTNKNGQDVTAADVAAAFGVPVDNVPTTATAGTTPPVISKKHTTEGAATPDRYVWNPATRDKFFGGNPAVSPMYGDDSFYTKTAKSLSTFNLTDGRIGEDQAMHNFTDYMIGSDGVIIGLHPIYGTMVLGRVDIATFDNPNGLEKVGSTNFRATVASGPAYVSRPGEEGAGAIVPNALEMSNVDLADEFTNMITTQRGYQANSRVITVSDTMIEELLSLKR